MPTYSFVRTRDLTESQRVRVEAESLQVAHAKACGQLSESEMLTKWEHNEGSEQDAYIPMGSRCVQEDGSEKRPTLSQLLNAAIEAIEYVELANYHERAQAAKLWLQRVAEGFTGKIIDQIKRENNEQ